MNFGRILNSVQPFSFAASLLVSCVVLFAANVTDASSRTPDDGSCPNLNSELSEADAGLDTVTADGNHDLAPCVRTGEWVGALAGATMGVLHVSWRVAGVSGPQGPLYKNVMTAVPSVMVGGAVGSRMTGWATKKILGGRPSRTRAIFRGVAYGAIDGAVTLTASLVPLLILGHYLETIDFNFSEDLVILKVAGAAVAGGTLYGGVIGAGLGSVYGLTIRFCVGP